jgi:hypothetical protein
MKEKFKQFVDDRVFKILKRDNYVTQVAKEFGTIDIAFTEQELKELFGNDFKLNKTSIRNIIEKDYFRRVHIGKYQKNSLVKPIKKIYISVYL